MVRFANYEDLETYVRRTLCLRADLDFVTPMVHSTLFRKGRPCGVEFTLLAPRSVRLSAIWEAGANRLLFYDQDLDRFQTEAINGLSQQDIPEETCEQTVRSLWGGK